MEIQLLIDYFKLINSTFISTKFMWIWIINVCCILHNFISDIQRDMDDLFIHQVDQMIFNEFIEAQSEVSMIMHMFKRWMSGTTLETPRLTRCLLIFFGGHQILLITS